MKILDYKYTEMKMTNTKSKKNIRRSITHIGFRDSACCINDSVSSKYKVIKYNIF